MRQQGYWALQMNNSQKRECFGMLSLRGSLRQARSRKGLGFMQVAWGWGQAMLAWLETTHAPPHSFSVRWEPPGPALPWCSVGFKATWKRKVHSLCWRTPPAPTMPPSSSSLFPPGRTDDSPFLNKAILPHLIHMLCLDFSIWHTKTRIFWSQTAPAPLTGGLKVQGQAGLHSETLSQKRKKKIHLMIGSNSYLMYHWAKCYNSWV
jgi:hypothetical protein